MADVEIFEVVNTPVGSMPLVEAMARRGETQAALDAVAETIRAAAAARHAAYPRTPATLATVGHSEILPVESGDVDRFIVFADTESDWAAAKVNNITGALAAGVAAAVLAKGGL